VRAPALVIEAGADPFAAPHAATLAARLRGATRLRIEGGMVPLPEQMPEAFAAAVDGFLGAEG